MSTQVSKRFLEQFREALAMEGADLKALTKLNPDLAKVSLKPRPKLPHLRYQGRKKQTFGAKARLHQDRK